MEVAALPLPIGQIGAQFFLAPTHRDHETNPVAIFHRTGPSFTADVAPDGPLRRGAAFFPVRLPGVKKELHPAFLEQNLRDAMTIFVLKDARPARPEIRKAHRHVEVLELEFHEKIIAQINRIGAERVELCPARAARDHEHLFRRR